MLPIVTSGTLDYYDFLTRQPLVNDPILANAFGLLFASVINDLYGVIPQQIDHKNSESTASLTCKNSPKGIACYE